MVGRMHLAKFPRCPTTLLSSMLIRPRVHIPKRRSMTPHNSGTWCSLTSLTLMGELSIQAMTRTGRPSI